MTFDDRQQYKVLRLLSYTEGKEIPSKEFRKLFETAFGNSADDIYSDMFEQKLIGKESRERLNRSEGYDHTSFVTKKGIEKYILLRKQRCYQIIKTIAFWILFAASLFAGIDVVIKWASKEKSQPSTLESTSQSNPTPTNPTTSPSQILKPDSTSGYPKSHDSLSMKKNETSTNDTAALRHTSVDKTQKPNKK